MLTVFELAHRRLAPSLGRRLVELLSREHGEVKRDSRCARKVPIGRLEVPVDIEGELSGCLRATRSRRKATALAQEVVSGALDEYGAIAELVKTALYALSKRYLYRHHSEIDGDLGPDLRKPLPLGVLPPALARVGRPG